MKKWKARVVPVTQTLENAEHIEMFNQLFPLNPQLSHSLRNITNRKIAAEEVWRGVESSWEKNF